ncbi:coproporphyrinogen III oxidase [Roseospirillum parvum]|uniref:coproporphyrinogen oxidase n=1 Tax=Roseospirillum parvum TaxID=83401 RepID=A0A1G7WFE6_9PROT|nr:coproporphyrinogen III oxidase [Roseospirillum parvum]SDG70682.1 coproporphyrinogen oxidase [Roseospirillum parvum]
MTDTLTTETTGDRAAPPATGGHRIDPKMHAARSWFAELGQRAEARLGALEAQAGAAAGPEGLDANPESPPTGGFQVSAWERPRGARSGGGGTLSVLRGRVLEKVGLHVYTVFGEFPTDLRDKMPGAARDPRFWSTGISLTIHPMNPHIPSAHYSSRLIVTSRGWFGGGCDLSPALPRIDDTMTFHAALREVCDQSALAGGPGDYDRFKAWCDDVFFLPHRNTPRGVGGLFFDDLNSRDWSLDFTFVKEVGTTFLKTFETIARRHLDEPFTAEERRRQQVHRGRLAEFTLLNDRGVMAGLKTHGNPDAVLVGMPPEARWP